MHPPRCLEPPTDRSAWAPPLDVYDVAVRLETAGVTDRVAREDYGLQNTLELAEGCFPELKLRKASASTALQTPSPLGEYLKGVSFGYPLLLCSLAMFLFRFSLWGGDVTAETAAAVGIGTISSFVVTGGFVQGMARRCMFLLSAAEGRGALRLCRRWTTWAIAALALSALALAGISTYFRLFPLPLLGVLVGFHIALGLLWLAAGLLHILERNALILSACAIGLVTVVGGHFGLGLPVIGAQIAGILVAAGCAFRSGYRALRDHAPAASTDAETRAMDLYITWPYFTFGLLYYFFLFADRLLAWTVPDLSASLPIVFRGDYETGLDIALIAFVLGAGAVRPAVVCFFHRLQARSKTVPLSERAVFCAEMMKYYGTQSLRLAAGAVLVSLAVWAGARRLIDPNDVPLLHITMWSLMTMPCLVLGLWNVNLQFRLARPGDALRSIVPALAVDLVTGYILTRLLGYEFAAVGLALGALTFAALSCFLTSRRLNQLDFDFFGSAL